MQPADYSPDSARADAESTRWQLPDLLDFDYYVDRDEARLRTDPGERKRLTDRDRRLYSERIAPHVDAAEHSPQHRSAALRRWLGIRRNAEDPSLQALLPGSAFARGQRLVTLGLGVLGFLAGMGVAAALLQYDGQRPVNVSWYLFILVLLQLLLLGGTAAIWYARRSRAMQSAVQDLSLIGHVLKPLFARTAGWVQRQRLAHMPPDVREQAKARQGLIGGHFALYGPAAFLPMLIPPQAFGICFNLGAIVTTVALEWFTDLAFGWGTALNVSPGTIHGIAQFIALPWSWLFGEGVGFPTLEQVQGSRISLKDPLFIMDAEALRSWRSFLVLAVFTYGLLPRLVLLALSMQRVRRTLDALPFTHQRTQSLYARMITPQLRTAGQTHQGPEMPIPAPLKPVSAPRAAPQPEHRPEPEPTPEPLSARAPEPRSAPVPSPEPSPEAPPKARPQPKADVRPKRASKAKPAAKSKQDAEEPPAKAPSPPASTPSAQPSAARSTGRSAETLGSRTEPTPEPQSEPRQAPTQPHRGRADTDAATPPSAVAADGCVLLLHVDIADVLGDAHQTRLQQLLHGLSGWSVHKSVTFGGGSAQAKSALASIEDVDWLAPPARVALLADGSQPPITETLRFLRAVRAAAGEHAQVMLALVGDPDGDDPLPPLPEFEFQDWQRKIEQLGDPYLRLEMLAGPAEEAE